MIVKKSGHNNISEKSGAVAKGWAYQARDQKPGRDVAIKILPEEFTPDTESKK